MTQQDQTFELTRRKALAGLGTIGVASAGAGMGTTALFSDTESADGNTLTAGELNLVVDYETSFDQGSAGSGSNSGHIDGNPDHYTYEIDDVKPGDSGSVTFCPKIINNPGWLYVGSDGVTDYENGRTEPEIDADGSGGDPGEGHGELSENIQVDVAYCEPASEAEIVLESDATGGIRETDNWITATVEPGLTTTVTVELDGEVYGGGDSGLGEWPSNEEVYFIEVNIDVDNDGIDEAANDDDLRFGYAAFDSGARANAISNSSSASGNGGYLRRNTGGSNSGDSANRFDVAEEDLNGFTASESNDQLTYTFEINWQHLANDSDASLSSVPSEIQINEVFGGDGGEGVGATPNGSNDGRGDIDNVTDASGVLPLEGFVTLRELNNPDDYTLAALAADLSDGVLLDGEDVSDGEKDAYPGSENRDDQQGPCLCVDWEVPIEVGNVIQTDSVEFDVTFAALQERHNANPSDPFNETDTDNGS